MRARAASKEWPSGKIVKAKHRKARGAPRSAGLTAQRENFNRWTTTPTTNAEIKKALATRQKNRSQLLYDLIREKEESKRLAMLATQRGNEIGRLRKLLRKFLDLHLEDEASGDTLFGVANLRIEAREALEGKE
jgi:hypothetical protein